MAKKKRKGRRCKFGVNKNTGNCLKAPRRKKGRKKAGKRSAAGKCKTVTVCGRRRKICWRKNGKIRSNRAA